MKKIIGGAVLTIIAALLAFYIKTDDDSMKLFIFAYIMWAAFLIYLYTKHGPFFDSPEVIYVDEWGNEVDTIFDIIKLIFIIALPAIVEALPALIMVYVFHIENESLGAAIEIINALIPTFYFCICPIISSAFYSIKRRKLKTAKKEG